MPELLLVAALSCPQIHMQNVTKFPWNAYDYQMLSYAKKRCAQIWKDSECVKLFRKWGKQDYSVICGGKE